MSPASDRGGLVSVIIPNYNGEAFLGDTLRSALNQTWPDTEIIVVDDGSSDRSLELVSAISREHSRVRAIPLGRNSGLPAIARNAGVREARGGFVAFLDADDLWHPRKLELQMRVNHSMEAPFSCTRMLDFSRNRTPPSETIEINADNIPCKKITHGRLLLKDIIPTSSVVAARSLLLRHPFPEESSWRAVEDYICWLHIHQEIPFSLKIEMPLMFYRKSGISISSAKTRHARRVFRLLSGYTWNGRRLGLKVYPYFTAYVILSIWHRLLKRSL